MARRGTSTQLNLCWNQRRGSGVSFIAVLWLKPLPE